MFFWALGTEIAIWGTGVRARKFYFRFCNVYKVKFFMDNYSTKKEFNDVRIMRLEEMGGVGDVKIVIAVDNYIDICRQCEDFGLRLFDDYLPYDFFEFNSIDLIRLYELLEGKNLKRYFQRLIHNRNYAILIGNCQIVNIRKMLLSSKRFQSQYIIIDIPPIYMIADTLIEMIEDSQYIFENCSLYVTQYIHRDNGYISFLSTENIKMLMNKSCRMLIVPTLYFDLYFPQTVHQDKENKFLKEVGITVFPYGDCILNELSKKYSVEEIQEIVKWDNLFSVRLLRWHFQTSLAEMLEREKKCDIVISDFILENFSKYQLFYTKNHPVETVFIELGKRILEKLGFEDGRVENVRLQRLDACQELIYPSVSEFYHFSFKKELYLDSLFDEECSMEEMVMMYLTCLKNIV